MWLGGSKTGNVTGNIMSKMYCKLPTINLLNLYIKALSYSQSDYLKQHLLFTSI